MSKNKTKTTHQQFATLENLDLSNGFACDVETGICGPIDDMKETSSKQKEKRNADNDMV